jgi:hypothetical protein
MEGRRIWNNKRGYNKEGNKYNKERNKVKVQG